ncbi:MAG: tRNA pseudouridine(55) synthase, partial [Deltaproteobacteria bacterium]|nr:tRNA pseudouridine(55) synthase [Deltaproteobacteria bacterium]
MRGFLVVDKPEGISSHHVIAIFRALLGKVKIGHTGTLDPFATGVLVLAFGTCTRLISFLPEEKKTYRATLKLGQKTHTGDTEGEVIETQKVPSNPQDTIRKLLKSMEGEQYQVPPQFSAIKH